MNKRFLSVLLFAFIVSAGASVIIYRLIAAKVTTKATAPSVQMMIAARNLEAGTLIRDADLRAVDWNSPVPAHAVLKPEDAVGRGVIAAIYEGEPVLENRLAPKGAGAGMASMIPVGMRAVAVRVNEVVGVAGFVVPGMHVDILVSGLPPGGQTSLGTQTRTILQNIEVLSAGQDIKKDAEGKPVSVPVVNLLVTPEQAEVLSLASNDTRIQLVLRNPLDKESANTPGTALARIFGTQPAEQRPRPRVKVTAPPPAPIIMPPPPPGPKPQVVVEVITGAKRTSSKFDENAAQQASREAQ